ncbi:alpha-L-fucosidase [Fulvivirga maritima]|uniref:alpha-L-fucosidase n=1 Tax=Fulvivirga maritima TaxID=2904247 RepID=UPI001F3ABE45|nr:alpha-L-fucosidase [Fulvivirga maritima]UII25432.1 alpha-L-fucosidase [Fulvivirga maritima]
MSKNIALMLLFLLSAPVWVNAQENNLHGMSTEYDWPEDPKVLAKLDKWQDQKFGMIIHWGLYAQGGMVESWELTSEDWINRKDSMSYCEFKEWYWGLSKEFNPVNFAPEKWAEAAKDAGMKYVVFTTKHHDGFNMFDTQQTDFKITNGPFADHPKANVAKYVFEAFRNEGMMIGAYFSKPDWHSQYFWWDKYGSWDRNVNYNLAAHPERWNKYKQFAYNQVEELTSDYGSIDILWLDGGWVRPGRMVRNGEQSIDLPKIAAMARENQPGMLVVDRTVHGPYENYQTPERSIPDHQISNPWESCIPLANNWGYVPNDQLKSSTKIIHSLVEIVAKGGSLLLGIGPKPDGTLREEDMKRMAKIGDWLDQNGKAIYNTRITPTYNYENVFFTEDKEGKKYAIVNIPEGEKVPTTVTWEGNTPKKGSKIKMLSNGKKVSWKLNQGKVEITVPEKFISQNDTYPALAFEFNTEN